MITMQFTGYPAGTKLEKNVKTRWSLQDACSMHVPADAMRRNQAQNTDTKLWPIVRGLYGHGNNVVNLVSLKSGYGYAEIIDTATGDIQIATYNPINKCFNAAECNAAGVMTAYSAATRKGSVLLAAFMAAHYSSDGEMQAVLRDLEPYAPANDNGDEWDDPLLCEIFGKSLCILSSSIYYRIEKDVKPGQIRAANLSQLAKDAESVLFAPTGSPAKLVVATKSNDVDELKEGEYAFNDKRILTSEERCKVPVIPKTYVTPSWVRSVCGKIKNSTRFEQPFRNVLLTGPSGTGKTVGSNAMAFALGLPYAKITCGPDTDFFDLIGQMLPNTEKTETKEVFQKLNIPSFEDVENDFIGSYKKLFGKEPGKLAQPADCYSEILSRVLGGLQQAKDFAYIESDFLKAIENGWLVEIQEPTVIKRNSVLVGLNSILETDSNTASITLPTGKTIRRHPDTVVVMTTNSDYDGCGKIQQSVLSRMDIVMQIENPTTKELVERTAAKTGFKKKILLSKMANVMQEVNTFCHEHDISDGVCGPRELKNWAQEAILAQLDADGTENVEESSVITAMFSTFISKISQSPEDIEDVITGVINKNFDQIEVQSAKEAYLSGY